MTPDPTLAVKGALTLVQRSERVRRQLQRIRYLLKYGRLQLTVFGAGGVGKSTLARWLTAPPGRMLVPDSYQESMGVELFDLPHEEVGVVRVGPGQQRRRESDWPDLYRRLASGDTHGVINVVAYGYHTFQRLAYRQTEYYAHGASVADFVHTYTADRREEELRVLRALETRLADAKGRLWMVTLIAKQDLWWAGRSEVHRFYEQGEYGRLIAALRSARGAQQFHHEYLPAALVLSNFYSGTQEVLAPTAAGYDQVIQLAHSDHLLRTLRSCARRQRK